MDRCLDIVFSIARVVVNVLLAFMVVIITLLVALRGIAGYSITWAEEISLLCFMWVAFLSLGIGIRDDVHMRIELFVGGISIHWKTALEYVLNCILLFICFMMIYYGGVLTRFAMLHSLPATRLPSAVNYVVIPIVGVISFLHVLTRIIKGPNSVAWRRFAGGPASDGETEVEP